LQEIAGLVSSLLEIAGQVYYFGGDFGSGLFVGDCGDFSRFGCTRVGVAGGDCGPGFSARFLGEDSGVAVGDVPAPNLVVIGDMVS
jgi:hypothetical protein